MVVDAEAAVIIVAGVEEATVTTAKMKTASLLRLEKSLGTLAATIITAVIEETVVTAVVTVVVIVAVAAVIVAVVVAAAVVVLRLLRMMAVKPKNNNLLQLKLPDKDKNEEKNLNKTENANVIFKRQQLEFVKVSAMEMQIKELFVSYLKMID